MEFYTPTSKQEAAMNRQHRERMEQRTIERCWDDDANTFTHDFGDGRLTARCRKCHFMRSDLIHAELESKSGYERSR